MTRIGIVRDQQVGERRVAMTPPIAAKLTKLGAKVTVEAGLGRISAGRTKPTAKSAARSATIAVNF